MKRQQGFSGVAVKKETCRQIMSSLTSTINLALARLKFVG